MNRPPLFATILMLFGVTILCSLGTWQLYRLEWKTRLLQQLEFEYVRDSVVPALAPADLDEKFDFKHGTLTGIYDFKKQLQIAPRVYHDEVGAHVLTPLKLQDNSYILVNRGWVPKDWKPESEKHSSDKIPVTGLLRPVARDYFSPENVPSKDEWYAIRPAEIAATKHIPELRPYVLYVENTDAGYPAALPSKPDLPNNHFRYALFWFAMAGTLVAVYVFRFIRKPKKR